MCASMFAENVSTMWTTNGMGELVVNMVWNYQREKKLDWDDIAQFIRCYVTIEDAVRMYLPGATPRHHRIPCPIHNGKDYNLSYSDHGYKCFVCGESGDVISFVKAVLGYATRVDAIKRINADFHLNLDFGADSTPQISAEVQRLREENHKKQAAREAWETQYNALMDAWCKLDNESRVETDPWELARIKESMVRVEYDLDSMPPKPR